MSVVVRSLAVTALLFIVACESPAATPLPSSSPVPTATSEPSATSVPTATPVPTGTSAESPIPSAASTATLSPPSSTPSATAPPTASPSPVVTDRTGARMELVGDEPVFQPSLFGDFSATLAAAYFIAGQTHHAYVVAFNDIPGQQEAFHMTSADGAIWEVDPSDPFVELGIDLSAPGPIPGSVIRVDGEWVMYLWGIPCAPVERRRDLARHCRLARRSMGRGSRARARSWRPRRLG